MKSRFHYSVLALLAALAFIFSVSPARALTVQDIRIGMHPEKTRLVIELSEMEKFRVSVQADPWQLLVDLPSFTWQVGRISNPKASAIENFRQGALKPGISRIAIDLKQPVEIRDAFLLRRNEGHPDRLVIDFVPTSVAGFERARGKSFGLLDTGAISAQAAYARPPVPVPPPAPQAAPAIASAPTAGEGLAIPPRKPAQEAPLPPPAAYAEGRKPLIVIDPGHGGVDPGAIGANGIFEKHITLSMGKELAALLKSTGRYDVRLTRDTDTYLRLHQRVAFARKHEADLFISLHADSIGKSNVRGASIYTLSEKASDKQTEMLADKENRADLIAGVDLSHEDEQVAMILGSLVMRDTMNQSKFFANTVADTMNAHRLNLLEAPHRYAGFAVLKAPDIPSVLIEMGFMSNKIESQLLSTPDYRRKIAESILASIDAYFEKVRRDSRS